jgi:hypothetical protein
MKMKQLALIIAILNFFQLSAQEGTTLEEFRYLSKGYVYQLEMGLDAQKEGYLVKNLYKSSDGTDLVALYQIGNAEPRALLVILYGSSDKTTYLCLPNPTADSKVKELAEIDLQSISKTIKSDYQKALHEFLFSALSSTDSNILTYNSPQSIIPGSYQTDETLVSRNANLENNIIDATPKTITNNPNTPIKSTTIAEQSISGEVSVRNIITSENAVSTSQKKGTVAIKICVDMEGNVSSAKFTQRGSTTFDSYLKKVAIKAAKSIKFAKLDSAEQCGIVNYKFNK